MKVNKITLPTSGVALVSSTFPVDDISFLSGIICEKTHEIAKFKSKFLGSNSLEGVPLKFSTDFVTHFTLYTMYRILG